MCNRLSKRISEPAPFPSEWQYLREFQKLLTNTQGSRSMCSSFTWTNHGKCTAPLQWIEAAAAPVCNVRLKSSVCLHQGAVLQTRFLMVCSAAMLVPWTTWKRLLFTFTCVCVCKCLTNVLAEKIAFQRHHANNKNNPAEWARMSVCNWRNIARIFVIFDGIITKDVSRFGQTDIENMTTDVTHNCRTHLFQVVSQLLCCCLLPDL